MMNGACWQENKAIAMPIIAKTGKRTRFISEISLVFRNKYKQKNVIINTIKKGPAFLLVQWVFPRSSEDIDVYLFVKIIKVSNNQ